MGTGLFCALGSQGALEAQGTDYYSMLRLERVEEAEKLQKGEQTKDQVREAPDSQGCECQD